MDSILVAPRYDEAMTGELPTALAIEPKDPMVFGFSALAHRRRKFRPKRFTTLERAAPFSKPQARLSSGVSRAFAYAVAGQPCGKRRLDGFLHGKLNRDRLFVR